jgi:toxin YoeB
MYRILILKKAQADLDWLRKNDKASYLKSFDLVRELIENPRHGTGKPERLKYFEKEVYSRRINHKDRLIYTIYKESMNDYRRRGCNA